MICDYHTNTVATVIVIICAIVVSSQCIFFMRKRVLEWGKRIEEFLGYTSSGAVRAANLGFDVKMVISDLVISIEIRGDGVAHFHVNIRIRHPQSRSWIIERIRTCGDEFISQILIRVA